MEEILAIKFTTDFTDCSFECIHIYCNKKKKEDSQAATGFMQNNLVY